MFILIELLLLVALMQLLLKTEKPGLCTVVYSLAMFLSSLIFGASLADSAIYTAISAVLAFIWFWLLDRTRYTFGYWVILVIGLVLIILF